MNCILRSTQPICALVFDGPELLFYLFVWLNSAKDDAFELLAIGYELDQLKSQRKISGYCWMSINIMLAYCQFEIVHMHLVF